MVGTIGPLVQGTLHPWRWRLHITILFVSGFLAGSVSLFLLSFIVGDMVRIHELPVTWRRCAAGAGLAAFALVDVWARHCRAYCPLGLRRQTPRWLKYRRSMLAVVSIWGFDTGLAITTFRVAAATWGAILLTVLGLSGWQTGIAYGIAFTFPLTILLWTHRPRLANARTPGDAGPGELLGLSRAWQAASALLLIAGAAILGIEVLQDGGM